MTVVFGVGKHAAAEPSANMPLRMELGKEMWDVHTYKDGAPDGALEQGSLAQVTDALPVRFYYGAFQIG